MGGRDGGTIDGVDAELVVLADAIGSRLAGRQVATAESCTAGRVATALACAEDAASFVRGGLVCYQVETKRRLLDVEADSVYSIEAAVEMAIGVCRHLHADVSVATTGVAGDTDEDGVPPGTVFIATCISGDASARRYHFDGDALAVCEQATHQALSDLAKVLEPAVADEQLTAGSA